MKYLMRFHQTLYLVLLLAISPVHAENAAVFVYSVDKTMSQVYPALSKQFEASRFFVVKELNIGESLSGFSKKWGDDYNRNQLSAIRSMVFCNGWYANQVSNLDPVMLGICPLHLTLIEKDQRTTALFNRPSAISEGSPAKALLLEIEQEVIDIITKGLQ